MGSKMIAVIQNGKVINVGAWVAPTPIPYDAIEGEFDLTQSADGAFVLAGDYQSLRAAEYPPIGDQLDALFKAGVFPESMAAIITGVKAKYPKP